MLDKLDRKFLHVSKLPVEMHDLLRDMGREIAREMSPDQENAAEFSFPRMCRMSSTLGWERKLWRGSH